MSFRDILHDPRVVRALRELSRAGMVVSLYAIRKNYGVLAFDVAETAKRMAQEASRGRLANYVRVEEEGGKDVAVAVIEVPEYEAMPEPAEVRDEAARELAERLARKGIKSVIEIESDTRAYIAIDLASVAKYIARQADRALGDEIRHFAYYDREDGVLQVHVWKGPKPEEVRRLEEEGGEL